MKLESDTDWLSRTRLLLGDAAATRLASAKVCVFGLGAVGSYVVEGLARSGVGTLWLVDFDTVKASNLNRQLYALRSTLGRPKTDLAQERVLDINPAVTVKVYRTFAAAENLDDLLTHPLDLVVDAVDSLNPKVDIIAAAATRGIPVYSALGAATRMDAEQVSFGPLFATQGCPLGRLVRKRLRRREIHDGDLWCVYSQEQRNITAVREPEDEEPGDDMEYRRGRRRRVLGSLATITGLFGLRLAHEVVLRLVTGNTDRDH